MKKILILMMILCCALVTGCSGVSREEYDALMSENSRLRSDFERIVTEKNELASEVSAENAAIKECFEICNEMLGKPETAISSEISESYLGNISEKSYYYHEKTTRSAKSIMTFDRFMTPSGIAKMIKSHDDEKNTVITNELSTTSFVSNIFIYRYDDGEIIMSHFWYKDKSNNVQERLFWFSEDVADAYHLLA